MIAYVTSDGKSHETSLAARMIDGRQVETREPLTRVESLASPPPVLHPPDLKEIVNSRIADVHVVLPFDGAELRIPVKGVLRIVP